MNVFDIIKYDEQKKVLQVKQATKNGYDECVDFGVFDGSYPSSKTRRARVQNGGKIAPALTCNCESSLFVFENRNKKNRRRIMMK